MEEHQLLLPLVGALWACVTLVLNATKELNAIRDKVIRGKDGAKFLTLDQRRHIFRNDWRPLAWCTGSACFLFCAIALTALGLVKAPTSVTCGAGVCVGGYALLMGVWWYVTGKADSEAMTKACADIADESSTKTN